MTKCYTKEEQLYALDVLKFMAEEAKWEKLCQLNEEQKEKYSKLLENFKALNVVLCQDLVQVKMRFSPS